MAKPSSKVYTSLPLTIPNLSRWSVEQVKIALNEHEQGNFRRSAFLWESLDRNPKINSAVNRRVLAVLGLPSRLELGDGDGRKNASAVERIKPYWKTIASRKSAGRCLRDGLGLGVAFGQLQWQEVKGGWIPRVKPWHASYFHWDPIRRCYMAQTQQGLVEVRPGEDNWVIFSYDEWDEEPWMRGVVRCLGIPDAVRSYVVRDWARYSEVHGLPMRMLEVPLEITDEEEKKEVIDQVENPGSELTVVVPRGRDDGSSYKLSLVEPHDNSWEGFDRLKKSMDVDIAFAITGVQLGTENTVYDPKDNSEGVRQDYTEADAAALTEFYPQVTEPWARYNLGEDSVASAPRPCYDATKPIDKKATADTVKTLGEGLAALNAELRLNGQEVDLETYIQKFDIPLRPSKVKPPPAQPAQPGAPNKTAA